MSDPTSPFVSLVEASLIKVSYDSFADNLASVTISGSGPYQPEGVPGFKNPIQFVQDISDPLKFYATYMEESFLPGKGEAWEATNTFGILIDSTQSQAISVKVVIFGNQTGTELELSFSSLFPGFGSAQGDAAGDPF